MDNKLKIFIHIGCAKAASTTLQKHLFDNHSEINNLGIYPTGNLGKDSPEINYDCPYLKNEKLRKFYYNLVMLDGIEYRSSANLQLYQESIEPILKDDQVNLFSNERFTSVFFAYDDIESKANRLKEIFPDAKIVMILRNQYSMIVSQYRDWPFDPRCLQLGQPVSLDRWIKIALEDDLTKYFSSLKYYEIAEIYSELFGKDNVGLFLFEDLVHDIKSFADGLLSFLTINTEETKSLLLNKHENLSVSHRYNIYRMLCRQKLLLDMNSPKLNFLPNNLRSNILNFLKEGKKKDYHISPPMKSKIKAYFAVSNKQLQEKWGLNLSMYNYPLEY